MVVDVENKVFQELLKLVQDTNWIVDIGGGDGKRSQNLPAKKNVAEKSAFDNRPRLPTVVKVEACRL